MKKNWLLLLLLFVFQTAVFAQSKPKVMILGTYHFANPGADAANIQADDVKTEKRQKEIQELTDHLKAFNPTKIAVEAPFRDSFILAKYQEYLIHQDPMKMRPNEIYQVGFRLAGQLNHAAIYPIDFKLNSTPQSMNQLAAEKPEAMQALQMMIKNIQDTLNYWTEEKLYKQTISEFLHFMNTDEMIAANHSLYLDIVKLLWSDNYSSGAEMLSLWYERNAMIYQNLIRITDFEAPEERILILIGQGHVSMLKDHVQDASYYEWVDVKDYLNK